MLNMEIAIILKAPKLNGVVKENDVIYADAGYNLKDQVGKKNVLAVVGDFDSLGRAPEGEKIVGLNVEKDFTDGERAVRLSKELGADKIVIYGAYGGKIEHVLGNIALLKIAKNIGLKAEIKDGDTVTELIGGTTYLSVKKNSKLSLIPYGGNCSFIDSKGLYYPLKGVRLTPSGTLGISNETTDSTVKIEFNSGEALVIYEI